MYMATWRYSANGHEHNDIGYVVKQGRQCVKYQRILVQHLGIRAGSGGSIGCLPITFSGVADNCSDHQLANGHHA